MSKPKKTEQTATYSVVLNTDKVDVNDWDSYHFTKEITLREWLELAAAIEPTPEMNLELWMSLKEQGYLA